MGFPGGSAGKESACNAGDLGSIPGLGRSPGEGKATHSSNQLISINIMVICCQLMRRKQLSNFIHAFHFCKITMNTFILRTKITEVKINIWVQGSRILALTI